MPKARKLIRVFRAEQEPRLTQSKLARLAGLHRLRLWAIENGESPATQQEKIQIANALGVEVSAIAWPVIPPLPKAEPEQRSGV